MNDFTELENELRKLRPAPPSGGFFARVEEAMAEPDGEKIIQPERFHSKWVALGFGLAAAAVFLLFLRVSMDRGQTGAEKVARITPAPKIRSTSLNEFIPADATQVVYNTRDEGLHYSGGSEQPLRRLRYQTQQTLQWRNPATGASLRVSYPSEEVVLIPISGQ
jgi:hypothetical protein